jgi:hypothetical protein
MDFTNDRAPRRGVATTGAATPKTVVVTSPAFFAKRDKKMKPLPEFSGELMQRLAAAHPGSHVLVLMHKEWMAFKQPLLDAGAHTFDINLDDIGATMERLVQELRMLGVQFRPIRNIRTVSPLKLKTFIRAETCLVVDQDDYEKAGVTPDKEITFQDMVKKRVRAAWP